MHNIEYANNISFCWTQKFDIDLWGSMTKIKRLKNKSFKTRKIYLETNDKAQTKYIHHLTEDNSRFLTNSILRNNKIVL